MRRSPLGVILILSCAVLGFGQDLFESEFGDNGRNGFDLDLFRIGSNLRSLGIFPNVYMRKYQYLNITLSIDKGWKYII